MNLTETLWMPLLAGVLSSLLASGVVAVVARLRSGQRRDQQPLVIVGDNVQGDKVRGDKIINQRYEHHEHSLYVQQPGVTPIRSSSRGEDSDTWGLLIVAGVALVVAVLAFLLVWQYVLGLMIGTGAVLVLAAGWLTTRVRGCPSCRKRLLSLWFNTAVAVLAGMITWWFALDDRSDAQGLPGALAKVSKSYPRFDDGFEGRWAVIAEHGSDIPALLGAHSVFLIAVHMMAIAAIAVISMFAVYDALALVTSHWEKGPFAPKGHPGQVLATLVLAAFALACAGGPVERLLENHYPAPAGEGPPSAGSKK